MPQVIKLYKSTCTGVVAMAHETANLLNFLLRYNSGDCGCLRRLLLHTLDHPCLFQLSF